MGTRTYLTAKEYRQLSARNVLAMLAERKAEYAILAQWAAEAPKEQSK